MHILANENFFADAVSALRDHGHDVAWIRTDSPGISDEEVLARAQREDRILVTFDKDFGELAFRLKLPSLSGIILFRTSLSSAKQSAQTVVEALCQHRLILYPDLRNKMSPEKRLNANEDILTFVSY